MSLIKRLQDKITYNLDIYEDLNNLEIDLLEKDEADKVLVCLIHTTCKTNNTSMARTIIDYFDEQRINFEPLPTLTNIFLNPYFDMVLWKWVVYCFPEKEGSGYFLDLINFDDDINSVKIAKLLIEIFPNITNDEWVQLLELTDDFEDVEYHNKMLRDFLRLQTEKTGNYAKLPNWLIKNERNELQIYPKSIPGVKEAVKLILDDFSKLNITLIKEDNNEEISNQNEIKEMLISQYAISTSQEKIAMLKNVKNIKDFDDINIFQEYGPVNSCYFDSENIDYEHECNKYGGCRMLLCNEYKDDIDFTAEDYEITDWFLGKCEQCDKNIKAEHHALRMPLIKGGWKGCYCSFQCLEKNIYDPITAVTVGRMKDQITSIGIRDR